MPWRGRSVVFVDGSTTTSTPSRRVPAASPPAALEPGRPTSSSLVSRLFFPCQSGRVPRANTPRTVMTQWKAGWLVPVRVWRMPAGIQRPSSTWAWSCGRSYQDLLYDARRRCDLSEWAAARWLDRIWPSASIRSSSLRFSEATCSIASGLTCSTIRYPRRQLIRFGGRRPARARPGARLVVAGAGQMRCEMGSLVFAGLQAPLPAARSTTLFCSTVGPMLLCTPARR
ncbi:hypothetical protein B0J12DRAFT_193177 [Macrophomina phaseolina]|uniref:Uncharacterized protein n=1 Tax=Macrophomina phaseolina TaxID=35725 RepID=A0ABQ8G4I4_9PEZI|nr:hypothetical protein B0J12DRAFT_193177 [Macrophomina phaseolina]